MPALANANGTKTAPSECNYKSVQDVVIVVNVITIANEY